MNETLIFLDKEPITDEERLVLEKMQKLLKPFYDATLEVFVNTFRCSFIPAGFSIDNFFVQICREDCTLTQNYFLLGGLYESTKE